MLDIFYREVVQAVLLLGLESWVLLAEMEKTVEGLHTGFLKKIMGEQARRNSEGMWLTPEKGEMREVVRIQSVATYIGRSQGTVYQLLVLIPILKLCAREKS